MRVIALACAVALIAGCGGKNKLTVAGCLNDDGFLVTQSGAKVEGTSPAGVAFTLTVYASAQAAKRAAAGLDRHTTAVVSTGVVDYRGNPGLGARITAAERTTIRGCLEQAHAPG
jgi:Na+-translocating ferredoxin:NAD+ oxidoreductase RnfG subunit